MRKIRSKFCCLFGVSQVLGHSVIDKLKACEDIWLVCFWWTDRMRWSKFENVKFFWRETVGGNVGDSLIRCEGKSVDFYIIKRTLHRNVTKATAQFIKTHQEKLKNLSRSTSLQQTYSSADITWRNSGKSKECMMICTIRTGIVNYICSRVLRISELFRCRERSQTVRCCLEWLGRLKCQLDASLSFFSTVAKVFSESVT